MHFGLVSVQLRRFFCSSSCSWLFFALTLSVFFYPFCLNASAASQTRPQMQAPPPPGGPGQMQLRPASFNSEIFRAALNDAENDQERMRIYIRATVGPPTAPADSIDVWLEEIAELDLPQDRITLGYHLLQGRKYLDIDNEKSIMHYQTAADLNKQMDDPISYLSNMLVISSLHISDRDLLSAEEVLLNAILYASDTETEIPATILRSLYSNTASLYANVQAYDQAIYMAARALQYDDSPMSVCISRVNISVYFREIGDYENSREQLRACQAKELTDPQINMMIHAGLTQYFLAESDTAAALAELNTALAYIPESLNPSLAVYVLQKKGMLLLASGELERASHISETLISLPFPQLPPQSVVAKNVYLAHYNYNKGNHGEALLRSERAIELAEIAELPELLKDLYGLRSAVFEKMGNVERALEETRLQNDLNSRIAAKTNQREQASARVRYELRMNEANLASALSSEQSANQRFLLTALLSVGLLLLAFVLYRRYRRSEASVEQISEKLTKAELEHKKLQEFIRKNNERLRREAKRAKADKKAAAASTGKSNGSTAVAKADTESVASVQDEANGQANAELIQINKHLRIVADSISYVESEGNYVRIVRRGGHKAMLLERMSLKKCGELLPEKQFIRIHRSTIVNINEIERIESESLYLHDGTELKLSRRFKKEMVDQLT